MADSNVRSGTEGGTQALIPVRSNVLGGITAGKWHLVADRGDHAALCGREHSSVGPFTCGMSPNPDLGQTRESLVEWMAEGGYLCKRCLRIAA